MTQIHLNTSLPYPPVRGRDYVSRLADIRLHIRRDNLIHAVTELESLLADFPWGKEAADLYGWVMSKVHHVYDPRASFNLAEWISNQDRVKMGGRAHSINDNVERFLIMKNLIHDHLQSTRPGQEQWADIADIGAQHGEMTINWIGIPGARHGLALEISVSNCLLGRQWYEDPRLHHISCLADQLPVPDGSVQIAVLSGILEHVLDPDKLVQEAERITKDGGLIVVQVPFGGMENGANPNADDLAFQCHVHSIDPYRYTAGKDSPQVHYVDYTNVPTLPHSYVGSMGDWVAAWVHRRPAMLDKAQEAVHVSSFA